MTGKSLTTSVTEHVRAIKALIPKLEHVIRKADEYYRAIGAHLIAIKKARPHDWETIVRERCDLGRSRSYELMSVAAGTKTVEQLQAEKAERVRQFRERGVHYSSGQPVGQITAGELRDAAAKVEDAGEPPAPVKAFQQLAKMPAQPVEHDEHDDAGGGWSDEASPPPTNSDAALDHELPALLKALLLRHARRKPTPRYDGNLSDDNLSEVANFIYGLAREMPDDNRAEARNGKAERFEAPF
jgi:hypothetical protein